MDPALQAAADAAAAEFEALRGRGAGGEVAVMASEIEIARARDRARRLRQLRQAAAGLRRETREIARLASIQAGPSAADVGGCLLRLEVAWGELHRAALVYSKTEGER
jgi:hypothetical protein